MHRRQRDYGAAGILITAESRQTNGASCWPAIRAWMRRDWLVAESARNRNLLRVGRRKTCSDGPADFHPASSRRLVPYTEGRLARVVCRRRRRAKGITFSGGDCVTGKPAHAFESGRSWLDYDPALLAAEESRAPRFSALRNSGCAATPW